MPIDVCREIDEMLKREKCLEILLVLAFNFQLSRLSVRKKCTLRSQGVFYWLSFATHFRLQ